jgi:hypothetical protein
MEMETSKQKVEGCRKLEMMLNIPLQFHYKYLTQNPLQRIDPVMNNTLKGETNAIYITHYQICSDLLGSLANLTGPLESKQAYPSNPKPISQSHSKKQMKINYVTENSNKGKSFTK